MDTNKQDRKSYQFNLRLDRPTRQKLEALAQDEEVPIAQIMRWALREYLRRHAPDGSQAASYAAH